MNRQITDFQLKIRDPWRYEVWPNIEPIRKSVTKAEIEKAASNCGPWIFLIPRDFPCFADFFFKNRDSLANLQNQIVEILSTSLSN